MSLYLDASALVKLVIDEGHSRALRSVASGQRIASSELVVTEVPRAIEHNVRLLEPKEATQIRGRARQMLSRVTLLSLERATLEAAGRLRGPSLRALDAIHVVTALLVADDLEAFITYDRRQGTAATAAGLDVMAPGVASGE